MATAPKMTASRETKPAKKAVETANEKKEREMAEEKIAFAKRNGKVCSFEFYKIKLFNSPGLLINPILNKQTTVASAPKLTESKTKKEARVVETPNEKKEREMEEEKIAFAKRNGKVCELILICLYLFVFESLYIIHMK